MKRSFFVTRRKMDVEGWRLMRLEERFRVCSAVT